MMLKKFLQQSLFFVSLLLTIAACRERGGISAEPTAQQPEQPLPITITENIAYTMPEGTLSTHRLDLFAPEEAGGWPAVVVLHGSGEGKSTNSSWHERMAEQGLVVYGIDWPVGTAGSLARNNGARLRDATESVACAIQFARATAADHGGNPDRVVLVGFSAGAAVGALVAFGGDQIAAGWENYSAENGRPPLQSSCVHNAERAVPDAFVGVGGGYSLVNAFADYDLGLAQIFDIEVLIDAEQEIDVHLVHGASDTVAPPSQSRLMNAWLINAGLSAELSEVEGQGHNVMGEFTVPIVVNIGRK